MFADQTKFGEPQTITMQQLSYTGIRITDGTNDYSLKELINIVNQDNYEPQNLAEKFVKYCDLNDTITLTNDQTNGVVIVTSQFNA
ncbi:MAG: hypothetical protein MJ200_04070 [Mycoplasmoidaceae bacterium]|nr:hypothetical protein [Mycoplasmoidaceae bacterium]MCQ3908688.1 hypothetical protein [Mycoplasmoidaceae bacterium]MCQ3908693.1 hypothetical protein [Mycoplasmoidaceae bacterium]